MVLAASTTWYAARAGGVVAYLLLSASVAVGLLTTWALLLYAGSAWVALALLVHRVSLQWGTPQPTERST